MKPQLDFFNFGFIPNEEAAAVLLNSLTRRLSEYFSVTMVCATPGQNKVGPVEVVRYSTHLSSKRVWSRCLDYVQFIARSTFRVLWSKPKGGVVLCTEPPFVDSWVGTLCAWRKVPYFVVVHDFYPDFAYHSGILPFRWMYFGLRAWNIWVFQRAQQILCVSKDTENLLAARGVSNVTVIDHAIEPADIRPLPWNSDKRLVVGYAGNLGNACDLEAFQRAVEQLPDPNRFRFLFFAFGFKSQRFLKWAEAYPSVEFRGWIPRHRLSEAMAECDIHLVLTPQRQFGCVYASKLQTIFAASRPVLASLPTKSAMHDEIRRAKGGYSVSAEDPKALSQMLVQLADEKRKSRAGLQEMGENGRRYVQSAWNGALASELYRKVFEKALVPKTPERSLQAS